MLNISRELVIEIASDWGEPELIANQIWAWWQLGAERIPAKTALKAFGQPAVEVGKYLEKQEREMLGMAGKIPPFTVVVDTREQAPFEFKGILQVRGTLPTGDYSIQGYENQIAVERKSKTDAWGCCIEGRERFVKCLERLSQLDRAAVVIECSLAELSIQPPQIKRVTAATVVGSYISWSVQYGLPIYFCDNRAYAERVTIRFLVSWLKHRSQA